MLDIVISSSKLLMPNGVEYALRQNNDCWEFTGKLDPDGYPRVKVFKKSYRLNRVVLAHKLGRDIKPKHLACHSCDNPACLNPDHLWEGTNRDNIMDAISKGRITAPNHLMSQNGSRNVSAKLTEVQVLEIRQLYHQGVSSQSIAYKFNISPKTVQSIVSGRSWTHVGGVISTNLNCGSRNHACKLTENQVIEIRQLSQQGYSGKRLAKLYNVSDTLIYGILNRKIWKHI